MTVFKAITVAGGITKWGSESRVKILRASGDDEELVIIKVKIDDVIQGDAADIRLQPGDTVIISTGLF